MENNFENQDQSVDNSANNPVDYTISSQPILADLQTSDEYIGGEVKWYQKGWGKALLVGAIIVVSLCSIVIYLIIYNFGFDKSSFSGINNSDNIFTTSSDSVVTSSISKNEVTPVVKDPVRLLAEKMDRPLLGNPSSTLVIVEFADFQCSVCEAEFAIIRAFVTKHKNDVLYIFRNYIVIDENSNLLAQASLCAGDQGKFWILHDKFYTNFGSINSTADLQSLVQSLGMDWNVMAQCIQSGKYTKQISGDMSDGQSLGVVGTPTFFVNGKKIEGAVTTADWESILSKYKQITGQK